MRLLIAVVLLLSACGAEEGARHEVAIPWSLGGQWLVADLHTHTRFSDGGLTVDELTSRAVMNGCGVLVITDHGDPSVTAVSPEFFEKLDASRRKLPDTLLLAGLEWNVPPYDGRVHVNLIVAPQVERTVLPQFRRLFDRGTSAPSADPALTWLANATKDPAHRVLIYNHPLRHSAASAERVEKDLNAWWTAGGILVGFEGAPGHQRGKKIGAYRASHPLQDRWDPIAAQIGGVWDKLLARGVDIWGAIANSDYHNDKWDEEPCRFSQTFLQVPERSAKGVLQAIRAGTFWAGHGRFLRRLNVTVYAPGLNVPAAPGEIIRHRPGAEVLVRVVAERSAATADRPLTVEIIGNCRSGRTESIAAIALAPGTSDVELPMSDLKVGEDGRSCYVRARVRNVRDSGGDLMAYTNSIRIRMK